MPKLNDKRARKGFIKIKTVGGMTKRLCKACWEEEYTYVHHQTGGRDHWQWLPIRWLTAEEYENYLGEKT